MAFGGPRTAGTNQSVVSAASIVSSAATVAVGDLVVVEFEAKNTTVAISGISDSLGHTWTQLTGPTDSSSTRMAKWYTIVTTGTSMTVTVSWATAHTSARTILVQAFEGPFTASPLDANPANSTDSASPFLCPFTGTLAQADELVVGFLASSNGQASPVGANGFTLACQVATGTGANSSGGAIVYQVVAATTSVQPQITASGGGGGPVGTASFKKGSAGTTYNQNVAGGVTPAGTQARTPKKNPSGGMTPAAILARALARAIVGAMTPGGALSRSAVKPLSGGMTPSAAVTRRLTRAVAGAITPAAAIVRTLSRAIAGSVASAGTIVRVLSRALGGNNLIPGGPRFRVVAQGDSITADGSSYAVVANSQYTARRPDLWNLALAGRRVDPAWSDSVNDTTRQYWHTLWYVPGAIYSLMAGVNDLNNGRTPTQTYNDLKTAWSYARSLGYKVIAHTLTYADPSAFPALTKAIIDELNGYIAGNSTLYDALVDANAAYTFAQAPAGTYTSDGLHPTAAAHAIIAPWEKTAQQTVMAAYAGTDTSLRLVLARALAGVVASASTVVRTTPIVRAFSGAVASSGAIQRRVGRGLSASIASTGAVVRKIFRSLDFTILIPGGPRFRVVAQGDSITADSISYARQANELYASRRPSLWVLANVGRCVRPTPFDPDPSIGSVNDATRQYWHRGWYVPGAIYSVMAGINDIHNGRTATQVYNDLKTNWSYARSLGYKVIAHTLTYADPAVIANATQAVIDELNGYITGDATLYDALVNANAAYTFAQAPAGTYTSDGLHPTVAAHAIIAPWEKTAQQTVMAAYGSGSGVSLLLLLSRSLGGGIASSGVVARGARYARSLAGTVANAGTLARSLARSLAGTVASVGTITRKLARSLAAAITPVGTLTRSLSRALAGTIASVGTITRKLARSLAAAVSSAGSIARSLSRALAGTIASSGVIARGVNRTKTLAGTIASAGTIARQILVTVTVAGAVASSGALARAIVRGRTLSGAVASAGGLSRSVARAVQGAITPSGAVLRQLSRSLAGAVASAGTLARSLVRSLAGTVAAMGTTARTVSHNIAGTIAATGTIARRLSRALSGAVASVGNVARNVGKTLAGFVVSASELDTTGMVRLSGAATPVGSLIRLQRLQRVLSGIAASSGSVARKVAKGLSGATNTRGRLGKWIAALGTGRVKSTWIATDSMRSVAASLPRIISRFASGPRTRDKGNDNE